MVRIRINLLAHLSVYTKMGLGPILRKLQGINLLANLFFSSGNFLYIEDLLSDAENGNNVARSCAEKCHTDGGGVGDLSALGVGLVGADYVVGYFHIASFIENLNY